MSKVTNLSLAFVMCLAMTFEPSYAYEMPLWGPLVYLGQQSFKDGKFDDAVKSFTEALAMAEKAGDKTQQGRILSDLSVVYRTQGKMEEGEKCLMSAVKLLGGDELNETNLPANGNLASLYVQNRKYSLAEPLFQRIEQYVTTTHGASSSNMALILRSMSEMYIAQRNYKKGEELLNRALIITKTNSGTEGAQVAVVMGDLALLYNEEGKYAEAAQISKEALVIEEKNRMSVALTLRNLADAQIGLGNYSEAELLLKKSLPVQEEELGASNPTIALTLASLGKIYTKQGKYSDAKQQFDRAVELRSKLNGGQDRKLAWILRSYAELERLNKHPSQSVTLEERAKAIEGKSSPR
ncbi:MAG: tetratricopeptide repeat protein [Candidatus Obscuribacterales bacterium]|nr:tetratricopeptide repeat protein [Candidatus Obscuribacterales bacterium]